MENKNKLFRLSSGAPAPTDIQNDLLSADKKGEEAYKAFVHDRLLEQSLSFNAPIKKQKLKTFANTAKSVKVLGKAKTRQITAEQNVFSQLVLPAVHYNLSLEKVLQFPLGPVPWSLATADGFPTTTNNLKLMHQLEDPSNIAEQPSQASNNYIIDWNVLLQAQVSLPATLQILLRTSSNSFTK